MSEQEYYHSSVGHCMIWGDVVDKPDMVIVSGNGDYGEIQVVRRSELVKKEDTWEFQQAQKRKKELEEITKKAQGNLDKLADRLVDKSIRTLASRIKFNVAFGEGGTHSAYAIMLSTELEKLIKEKAPEAIKGKELFE